MDKARVEPEGRGRVEPEGDKTEEAAKSTETGGMTEEGETE
jgi:hypothetical protein